MSDPWPPRTFAELIARTPLDRPLLIGADDAGLHRFDGRALRRIARCAAARFSPGDGVMLARAPASPEAPLAGVLFGLLAAGVRVYLPATVGAATAAHLAAFEPAAVITDQRPVRGAEADGRRFRAVVDRLAAAREVPHLCLHSVLERWLGHATVDDSGDDSGAITDDSCAITGDSYAITDDSHAIADDSGAIRDDSGAIGAVECRYAMQRSPRRDLLCLTTSGSTGEPQALRYAESAWMACGAAFEAAGLLTPDLLGGPTVCPGLCHSLGVRAVLLALWCGAPTSFVQPEWLTTAPAAIARVLRRHPPHHITAGPALLGALPALAESAPALRRIVRGLRVVVSSGAAFDPRLPATLPDARWANAFGTSETQQICTTLLDADAPLETLGRPLPGVETALRDGLLWVRSPLAASGCLGAPDLDWWPTGDRIALDAESRWRFAGRADDHVSTGLGVELARGPVEARYRDLPGVQRLVVVTHPECPGLLGLAFLGGQPFDRARLTAALRARAVVHPPQAAFDADRLWAVAPIVGGPPLIGPGKLDRRAIARTHRAVIARLADPEQAFGIDLVDPLAHDPPDPVWPQRAPRARALGLDLEVVGGRGDHLDVRRGGERFTVLDLVGGFGVNLLGHDDPDLLAIARRALGRIPIADQGSVRPAQVDLCRALAGLLARHTDRTWAIRLVNTGAEALDLALRHALSRRSARLQAHHRELRRRFGARAQAVIDDNRTRAAAARPIVVTVEGGFHGTTWAARLVAGHAGRRRPIDPINGARVVCVPRSPGDDRDRVLARLAAERLPLRTLIEGDDGPQVADWRPSNLLAVCVEAVQGEGGVHPLAPALLRRLSTLDAPLIVDEIQAGLGRCGALLAASDVPAEVYLFGKALGGGLAKVAAVAIAEAHLQPALEALQGSTFAGDGVGCRVARAVIERIEREDVPARAAAAGEMLGAALRDVALRWPAVIAEVRGRGLLWGVELRRPPAPDALTAALAEAGWGAVAASWLLHRHHIRALPTTAAPDVLRIAPSVGFDRPACDALIAGLDGLCAVLHAGDLAALVGPWVGARLDPQRPPVAAAAIAKGPAEPPAARVAFIHPLHAVERAVTRIAPALQRLERDHRQRLIARLSTLLAGAPLPAWRQRLFDGRVELCGITICAPPAAFTLARRRGDVAPLRMAVDAALRRADDLGATLAVLGGATSAITDAGRAIDGPAGLRVVTGNTFTVATILHRLESRAAGLGPQPTVAILGATGNLGRALAVALSAAGWIGELLLVGRPGSAPRLAALAETLPRAARLADDPRALRDADLILSAVDDPRPLDPAYLPVDRPAAWLDASAPSIVPPDLARQRPQIGVAPVGRARLPLDPTARIAGMGRPGTLYACAAEGLLLALEPDCWTGPLVGPIDPDAVAALAAAGRRWGLLPAR